VTNIGGLCQYLSEMSYPLLNYHYVFVAVGYRSHAVFFMAVLIKGDADA